MAVIEVEGLRKRYGDTVAVAGVSFAVEEGEIFGLLGPNGAGKTTTVECVTGLRDADGGHISVLGHDPRRDREEVRRLVGVQLQESQLPDKLRVGEALELYRAFYLDADDSERLMAALRLTELRDRPFKALSGGQRQRLSIALALIGRPRIAVLDELTTGLDPHARRDTWELIEGVRDSGVTIVLVTHAMEEAERLCDRVAVIDRGRVVAIDAPAALAMGAGARQRIRFRPSAPVPDEVLLALDPVESVAHHGQEVVVNGVGDALGAVVTALAARGIVAQRLRLEGGNLEDAFVALTGAGGASDEEER